MNASYTHPPVRLSPESPTLLATSGEGPCLCSYLGGIPAAGKIKAKQTECMAIFAVLRDQKS